MPRAPRGRGGGKEEWRGGAGRERDAHRSLHPPLPLRPLPIQTARTDSAPARCALCRTLWMQRRWSCRSSCRRRPSLQKKTDKAARLGGSPWQESREMEPSEGKTQRPQSMRLRPATQRRNERSKAAQRWNWRALRRSFRPCLRGAPPPCGGYQRAVRRLDRPRL